MLARASDETKAAGDAIRQQIVSYTAALDAADFDLASQFWRTSPRYRLSIPVFTDAAGAK